MKKTFIFLCFLMLILLCVSGCHSDSETEEISSEMIASNMLEETIRNSGTINFSVDNEFTIVNFGEGIFYSNNNYSYYLVEIKGKDHLSEYLFCIKAEDDFAIFPLGKYSQDNYKLYCVDIDNDASDEIVLQLFNLPIKETFPSSWVLKFDGKKINNLFCADGTVKKENQVGWKEPGFEITFENQYKIAVQNSRYDYKEALDAMKILSSQLLEIIYDKEGNINEKHPTYGFYFEKGIPYKNMNPNHCYYIFKPIDIDQDGIYELIAAKKYTYSFQSIDVYIGDELIVLKYMPEIGSFTISSVDFICNYQLEDHSKELVSNVPLAEIYS